MSPLPGPATATNTPSPAPAPGARSPARHIGRGRVVFGTVCAGVFVLGQAAANTPVDNRIRGTRLSDNGGIDDQTPAPRTSRRLADALIRSQIRAQNNPRRTGRVAGAAFALLLFLAMGFGFFFAFDDRPLYLVITLALLGAVLGGALFTVTIMAFAHRSVGGRLIPAETDPADVRAARRALRTGQLSGRFQVDRIARVIAAQALRREVRPWVVVLVGTLIGGSSLLNAFTQYQSHDGWHWKAVFLLVAGACYLVGTAAGVPLASRSMRRTRAFAEAYDARRRKRPPEGPERP